MTDRRQEAAQGATRRIVTGVRADGRPGIVSDGPPPRAGEHKATPGMINTVLWSTSAPASTDHCDPTPTLASLVPDPGETVALLVTFPPDTVFTSSGFDPDAAGAENLQLIPGLAELFESDHPGMHTTPTVDYAVVTQGELVLDLGDESTVVRPGELVVQNGTRHAWRNPTLEPATALFVLIGAARHSPPQENAR